MNTKIICPLLLVIVLCFTFTAFANPQPPPHIAVNFNVTPTSQIINSALTFTASATDQYGHQVTFAWDKDYNGSFAPDATGQNQSWSYSTPGCYRVRLRAQCSSDANSDSEKTVYIYPAPVSNSSPINGAENQSLSGVTLTWNAVATGATNYKVYWGPTGSMEYKGTVNGTSTSWTTPALNYGQTYSWRIDSHYQSGSYDLTKEGTDVWTFTTLPPLPEAVLKIQPSHVIIGRPILLDGHSSSTTNGIVKYEWDWTDDGTYEYAETAVMFPDGAYDGRAWHVYPTAGTFDVRLRVTDSTGSQLVATTPVTVSEDWDNDGLPDAWEIANFSNITSSDGTGNHDADDYNDFCEYLHDSNPKINDTPSAMVITVPGDVKTIQGAIDASITGDTIIVCPGTYNENIDFKGKPCTVTSVAPNNWEIVAKTIIKATDSDTNTVAFKNSETSSSVLEGFTITGGRAGIHCKNSSPSINKCVILENGNLSQYGVDDIVGGIYTDNSSATINNCFIIENRSSYGGGMHNKSGSGSLTIINCVFYGNVGKYGGGALYNESSNTQSYLTLRNCTIVNNKSSSGYGGGLYNYIYTSSGGVTLTINVYNTILWGNTASQGNQIYNACFSSDVNYLPIFHYSDIEGGICINGCQGSPSVDFKVNGQSTNKNCDPYFADIGNPAGKDHIYGTKDDGLRLRTASCCIDAGDSQSAPAKDIIGQARVDIGSSTVDIGAYELNKIWYVKPGASGSGSSWGSACSLQTALSPTLGASSGDEIWVEKGTYTPGSLRSDSFLLKSNVSVCGGFAGTETDFADRNPVFNPTILSGDIGTPNVATDNSYHVVKGATGALIDGFIIQGGYANGSASNDKNGGGLYADSALMSVRNCVVTNNHAQSSGGGIYSQQGSIQIANCVFVNNISDTNGGAILTASSYLAGIINCTVTANSAGSNGGGIANVGGSQSIVNSIIWGNTVSSDPNNIYNNNAAPAICSSDVKGSGGSTNWQSAYGVDYGGNIDSDPCFVNSSSPAGVDANFATFDDGLRLLVTSPCIDIADNNVAPVLDILGFTRLNLSDTSGKAYYADMGAYEWKQSEFPYITSFEKDQGFDTNSTYPISIDGIEGWNVSENGEATVQSKKGFYTSDQYAMYQFVKVGKNNSVTTISRKYEEFLNDNGYIRISCVPNPGSSIDILSNSSVIASVRFKNDGYIWLLNSRTGSEVNTGISYQANASVHRGYVLDPCSDHLYDASWIDIEILFDWLNHQYTVTWMGTTLPQCPVLFNTNCFNYTEIKFIVPATASGNEFLLNRISASNLSNSGGTFGPDADIYITSPTAVDTIEGRCKIIGSVWYDKLSRYEIKCCPTELNPTDSSNWVLVCQGTTAVSKGILGHWNADNFKNGLYYLKIDVYDDLGRKLTLQDDGTMKTDLTVNGPRVNTQYILNGLTGKMFSYTEKPDIEIQWPGQFPFTVQRMYSHGLRNCIGPFYYGWTHNHDIKVFEDTRFSWESVEEKPRADFIGLGIGKQVWLQDGVSFRMFTFYSSSESKVTYKPSDYESDYIERISSVDGSNFKVTYIHYASDGVKMTFESTLAYSHIEGEGVVNWCIYKGIKSKEDRFGNALVYTWYTHDNNDTYVQYINTKMAGQAQESDVTIVFKKLDDSNPLSLCGEIQLKLRNNTKPQVITTFSAGMADKGAWYGSDTYRRLYFLIWGAPDYPGNVYSQEVSYNTDDTISTLGYSMMGDFRLQGFGASRREKYTYTHQPSGCLLTKIDYRKWYETYIPYEYDANTIYKSMEILQNKQGLVLSEKTRTFKALTITNKVFNPYDYSGLINHNNDFWYQDGYAGGGGCISTDYVYGDSRFPYKPTIIYEHFDDNGDGSADSINDRPVRKTTMAYDARGNLSEKRVYFNSTDFVLTQYEYHPTYNFVTRQTTWQDYATGDSPALPTGAKVEQQWVYGDANGIPNSNGNYIVQEKTLLNESTDACSVTSYKYNANGQIKTKTEPRGNVTYYEYDPNGLLSKEWQGAALVSGLPQGNPTKRYYYDASGFLRLEGDYLGQVKMYFYDSHNSPDSPGCSCRLKSRPMEIRKYVDLTAMSRTNFVPAAYDQNIENSAGDTYVSKESFTVPLYDRFENPWTVTLPYGGVVEYHYVSSNIRLGPYEVSPDDDSYSDYYCNETCKVYASYTSVGDVDLMCYNYYNSMGGLTNRYKYYTTNIWNQPKAFTHEQFDYDASGNKISEKLYDAGYNASARVLKKNSVYDYDILDRMITQIEDAQDPCNPAGHNITTDFDYDAAGNRIYVIDPNGNIIFTDYDNANRRTLERFALRPTTNPINFLIEHANATVRQRTEYYNDSKVKAVTSYDTDGTTVLAKSEYAYDSRGRISEVNQSIDGLPANNAITTYDYNDVGFTRNASPADPCKYQICITDAELKQTWVSLNPDGKLQKIVYPSGDYEKIVYDGNGLPVEKSVWTSAGVEKQINYKYDKFGKVTEVNYPDNPNRGCLKYEYTGRILENYGKIKKITDFRNADDRPGGEGSTFEYEYDFITGNIRHYKDCNSFTIDYEYNQAYPSSKTSIRVRTPVAEPNVIYDVNYVYDCAGRLRDVKNGLANSYYFSRLDYTPNGNRSQLKYYFDGSLTGPAVTLDYSYNQDNCLTSINTTCTGTYQCPIFTFEAEHSGDIDGLGRLHTAHEEISRAWPATNRTHDYQFTYDMLSELKSSQVTNIGSTNDTISDAFDYYKDGNIQQHRGSVNGSLTITNNHSYAGDIVAGITGTNPVAVDHDLNGNVFRTDAATQQDFYNWDNKLAFAQRGSQTMQVKYDPMGNRVWKQSDNGTTTTRKYVVDIAGGLPTILCELDGNSLKNSYVYADGQILKQNNYGESYSYYYIHDRLGSIRQVISSNGIGNNGIVVNSYTYNPFGEMIAAECTEQVYNPFKFTGQWFDAEIGQYYLRARMYDPQLMRFTARDPVKGKFKEPMSLHKYLYCENDPINRQDPSGLSWKGLLEWIKEVLGIPGGSGVIVGGGQAALQGGVTVMSYNAAIIAITDDIDFLESPNYDKLRGIATKTAEEVPEEEP